MEEIEYKLKSKNVILVTEAVERLLELVVKASGDSIELENTIIYPLTLLKDKCTSEDPVVSLTASKGLLSLVTEGILDVFSALSAAMSMLPSAQKSSAMTSIISGVIALIAEQQVSDKLEYVSQWSLVSPQHPLVKVLQQLPDAVDNILNEVESLCLHNVELSSRSLELMRPVFLWIICDPKEKQSIPNYNRAIGILLELENCSGHIALVMECLGWQKVNNYSKRKFSMLVSLLDWAILRKNDEFVCSVILALANMAIDIIISGKDPRMCFSIINKALNYPGANTSSEVLLTVLSEGISVCPQPYLNELFVLCKNVHKLCESSISEYIFTCAVLQWLYYPTKLAYKATETAKGMLDCISKRPFNPSSQFTLKLNTSKIFNFIKATHPRLFKANELIICHGKLTSDSLIFNFWSKQVNETPNIEIKYQIVSYLCALLLLKCKPMEGKIDKLVVLKILEDVVEYKKELGAGILPIILNVLKNSKDPAEVVKLLREIVHLSISKENVPLIIPILETMHNDKAFSKAFLIDLYVLLVDKQTRCYPYLLDLLVDSTVIPSSDSWEVLTAKAAAVKLICEERAEKYGAEMVPIISGLLNRCTDDTSATAYCLTLDALKALWQARIVAPDSTWNALAPRIGKDKRPRVQVHVCKLLSEVPQLDNETPKYDAFVSEVLVKLWSYVVDSNYPEVSIAALRALSNFKVDSMCLKQLPEIYRKGAQLPPAYCKTPSDAARRPEDVLDYIPSECWSNLFKYTNQAAFEGVSDLCHTLMDREVRGYSSGVYSTTDKKGARSEPERATYLPTPSVVRGLLEFVRNESINPRFDCPPLAFLECLRCMGRARSRLLPPLQWNFLSELMARDQQFRGPSLELAAHQAAISGTCLRFLQNYLPELLIVKEKEEEISKIIEILPILCKNVPSNFLRDTLWKMADYALVNHDSICEECDMIALMKSVTATLRSENITEDNRNMLSGLVEHYFEKLDSEHKFWPLIVEACGELSWEYLERITAPSSWWEVSGEMLHKACPIRVHVALTTQQDCPIIWLNEIIDAVITLPREQVFVLQSICPVLMRTTYDNIPTKEWFLQLLARTQVHMAENSSTELSSSFLCDVVILSVLMFTSYYVFTWRDTNAIITSRALRLNMFPQALTFLLAQTKWLDVNEQILEWLHHSRSNKKLPAQYLETFYVALVAASSSIYFKKQNVWTKFLSVKPPKQLFN